MATNDAPRWMWSRPTEIGLWAGLSRFGTGPSCRPICLKAGAVSGASRPHLLWVNQFAVAPTSAGGTRHFEIGRELVRRGWNVTIAASDLNLHSRTYQERTGNGDHTPLITTIDGVRFVWLWAAPYHRNDWRRVWNWLSFSRSLSHAGRGRGPLANPLPDVVVGSSPQLFSARTASHLARRYGVPFVLEVRDLWPESLLAVGRRRDVAYYVLDRVARGLYRRADHLIVLAQGTADYLSRTRKVGSDRITYVPNGVDLEAFPPVERSERATVTFVYTGAHGPANDLDVVLGAAAQLQDYPEIRFLFVGSGPSKGRLVQDAETLDLKTVEFRGVVPKAEMPALLASVDVGVMVLRPSELFKYGVSPNKLFDYMASGLPVVNNVPGDVAHMVKSAGAGVQAAPGSPTALAEAILFLARMSPDERRAMGRSARAWVEIEHSRPMLADRLEGALGRVLREDRKTH